ncbi:MAG TPA: DUF3618 domain-containing protein [Mycobacteriales bacterium]|nr:DUF3618 domain-containing protein [Mycobacteriales bacterium]
MARDPQTIQREIEEARDALASTLDKLADRTSPKTLAGRAKDTLAGAVRSPAGIAGAGIAVALAGLLVIRRVRR